MLGNVDVLERAGEGELTGVTRGVSLRMGELELWGDLVSVACIGVTNVDCCCGCWCCGLG